MSTIFLRLKGREAFLLVPTICPRLDLFCFGSDSIIIINTLFKVYLRYSTIAYIKGDNHEGSEKIK